MSLSRLSALFTRGGACAFAVAVAAACGSTSGGPSTGASPTDPAGVDAAAPGAPDAAAVSSGDPFAAQPDESEGLTNVSSDLDALLEHGALKDACDRYRAGATDRKTMLLCGKWMFFYDPLGTSGVPAALVDFLVQNFPDEIGPGFEKFGLVPDPTSDAKRPLGLAPTVPLGGKIDAVAFTCASCHFARLPDGRYAVGAANHAYDYGAHILSLTLAPTVGMGLSNAADHDPAAIAKIQPVLDRLSSDFALKAKLGTALLPIASAKQPSMSKEVEHAYASWPKGALDFFIAPLPVDDGVEVVGKMISLWGLPRPTEVAASGMSSELLAWSGDTRTLNDFLHGFATLGGAASDPTDATVAPLAEYVYSLRAPAPTEAPDAALVARGGEVFASAGCAGCHDGPRGSGKRVYTFEEIGTDRRLADWLSPSSSGAPCCGIALPPGTTLGRGLKSPRLVGLWALRRFLHNGSLASLEQVLCAEPRPASAPEPNGDEGHTFGCELPADDKRALLAFLRAH